MEFPKQNPAPQRGGTGFLQILWTAESGSAPRLRCLCSGSGEDDEASALRSDTGGYVLGSRSAVTDDAKMAEPLSRIKATSPSMACVSLT